MFVIRCKTLIIEYFTLIPLNFTLFSYLKLLIPSGQQKKCLRLGKFNLVIMDLYLSLFLRLMCKRIILAIIIARFRLKLLLPYQFRCTSKLLLVFPLCASTREGEQRFVWTLCNKIGTRAAQRMSQSNGSSYRVKLLGANA